MDKIWHTAKIGSATLVVRLIFQAPVITVMHGRAATSTVQAALDKSKLLCLLFLFREGSSDTLIGYGEKTAKRVADCNKNVSGRSFCQETPQ